MKSCLRVLLMVTAGLILSNEFVVSQEDTVKKFKNTIKFNLTNPMIFSPKYNVIGYERIIRSNQSISFTTGRFAMAPFTGLTDSLSLTDQMNDKGWNFSVDYRFYLKKENKYEAPRGVYLGPYYAFNYFSRDLVWDINTDSFDGRVETGFDLMANLVGVQMGYQFVLWNRLSIDMILMGPGVWFFKLQSNFDTNLSADDEAMLLQKLNDMLKEKYPGSDFSFTGGNFEAQKTTSTATGGLRYMVNIGFRF